MNIKKCKKCGWEYPATSNVRTCRFCGEPFTVGYCSVCGEWKENLRINRCRECETEEHRKWRQRHSDTSVSRFDDWLKKIQQIPTPYKTLTEDQWLEACAHFEGCAYCGSEDISARSMFITFNDGGRYCAWNIIPSCERCETALKSTDNPFKFMNEKFGRSKAHTAIKFGYNLKKLQRIVDYLQSKMEEQ